MKILYHHRIGSKDGQAVHIESLIGALRRQGNEVAIVSPPSFQAVDFGGEASWLARLRRQLPRAACEILEICYNVPAFWRLWRAHRRSHPDLVYERYNLFTIAGVLLARLSKTPIFVEVNAPLAQERAAFGGLALARAAAGLERYTWRAADFVLPVSQVLAGIVRRAGVPAEKIVVIPNGIDEDFQCPDSDQAKRALGLQGKIVLGFVGFIRDWHGLDAVLDLLLDPECPAEVHFLVVGDGPALPALRSKAEHLGISHRTTLTGLVNREALSRHVAAFDVALQPSAVDYASPLKIFEYMAAGRAIVAPDQVNIREIIVDGETGVLFTPGSSADLREAALTLIRDPGLRERLGASARLAIFSRPYTWSENARRIAALYLGLRQSRPTAVGG